MTAGARHSSAPRGARFGDRAQYHAERPALDVIRYAPIVTDLMTGEGKARKLRAELAEVKAENRSQCSVAVAVGTLSFLAALNRTGARGWRGVIAPLEDIAEAVSRTTGHRCGERTARSVAALLEGAGYIDRGVSGRGNPERVGERWRRKMVTCWTLTPAAISLWSRAPKVAKAPVYDKNTHPANLAGRGMDEGLSSGKNRDARAFNVDVVSCVRSEVPEKTVSVAETACCAEQGASAPRIGPEPSPTSGQKGGIRRIVTGRPRPHEPETRQRGVRCIVYDLETELRRRARGEPEIADCVRRVLAETVPGYRGDTSQHWDDWVFGWRGMPAADRQVAISGALWPSLRASLKRDRLRKMPALPYVPLRPWAHEPGPRDPDPLPRPPPSRPPPQNMAEAIGRVDDTELAAILNKLAAKVEYDGREKRSDAGSGAED